MGEYILTYDIITSEFKASVFAPDGSLIACATQLLQMQFDGTHAQQSAESWWDALRSTTRTVLQRVPAEEICCLSFTDQVQVCLCVDRCGRPLYDAITWSDARSEEVSDPFAGLSAAAYQRLTGQRNTPHSPARKLCWVREHLPEVYQSTYKMLGCKDFLAMRLTGEFCTDYSDASCTGVWNIGQNRWSEELCSLCGIDVKMLPRAVRASEVIGTVSPSAAGQTGLSTRTAVVMGSGDFTCSAIGAGCVNQGDVYLNLGSSSWIATASDCPVNITDGCIVNNVHAVDGLYLPLANLQESGAVFKWLSSVLQYRRVSGPMANPYQNVYPYEGMEELARQAPAGSNGLLFLPFVLGASAASYSPSLAGSFVGLRTYHTRYDLVRSALEGVTYYFELLLELLCGTRKPQSILATGVASHETFWLQLLADILAVPIENTELHTTVDSIGAAILAGNGIGAHQSWDLARQFWAPQQRFEPLGGSCYEEGRQRFREAFFRLQETSTAAV